MTPVVRGSGISKMDLILPNLAKWSRWIDLKTTQVFTGKLVDYRTNAAFFIVLYSRLKIMGGNDCYLITVFLITVIYLCLFSNLYILCQLYFYLYLTESMFLIGLAMAPFGQIWYFRLMEKLIPGAPTMEIALKKVLADQIVAGPVFISFFLFGNYKTTK